MELAQPHPGALSPFVWGGFGVARPFRFGWDF
jgi:hypothetical protein